MSVFRRKFNPFTKQFDFYVDAGLYPGVETFAELPPASEHTTEIYIVRTASGVIFSKKDAGFYRSNGTEWKYLGQGEQVDLTTDQQISGNKEFLNPVKIPDGVNDTEAISKQQLDTVQTDLNSKFLEVSTHDLQYASTGWLSGGIVSYIANPTLNIHVTAGTGYIIHNSVFTEVSWNVADKVLSPWHQGQYVYVDEAGAVQTSITEPEYDEAILLAICDTNADTITFIHDHRIPLQQFIPKFAEYLEDVIGPLSANGGEVHIYNAPSLRVNVDAGEYFRIHNKITFPAETPAVYHCMHRNGSGDWVHEAGKTTIDNLYYDNGSGTLALIPAGKYKRDIVYMIVTASTSFCHVIYGQQLFDTIEEASVGPNPIVPGSHSKYALRLAAVISGPDVNEISAIVDQRPKLGQMASSTTSVTAHHDLTGLLDDDHTQYQLRTEKDQVSGYVGLDVNSKVPVSEIPALPGTRITVQKEGAPTKVLTHQDVINYSWSAGVLDGVTITDNGNGTINVSGGEAMLRIAASETADLKSLPFSGVNNLEMVDDTTTFIFVNYNGGTPIVQASTDISDFNCLDKCHVATITRNGNKLWIINATTENIDGNRKVRRRAYETQPLIHNLGGSLLGVSGLALTVTQGKFWHALVPIPHASFNTALSGLGSDRTFLYYYRDGVGGWTEVADSKQIDNTKYDDGTGTLANLTTGYYRVDWIYMLVADQLNSSLAVVYGSTEHADLIAAQAEGVLTNIPPELRGLNVVLLGKVIVQQGASSLVVASAFETGFDLTGSTEHNNLPGLQGGVVNEYNHLSNAQVSSLHTQNTDTTLDQGGSNEVTAADIRNAVDIAHEHLNKVLLDSYTQTDVDLATAVSEAHDHLNITILNSIQEALTTALKSNYDTAYSKMHDHTNKVVLDAIQEAFTTALKASYDSAVAAVHNHSNKVTLDGIQEAFTTALKAAYDSAVTDKHVHANKTVLDNIQEALTTVLKASYDDAVSKVHTHANKSTLDTYTQTEVNLADAVSKKHTQGTDQGLDNGGPNAVTAAQSKTAYTHSQVLTGNPHGAALADLTAKDHATLTNKNAETDIKHITDNQASALTNANAPSATNPVATQQDIYQDHASSDGISTTTSGTFQTKLSFAFTPPVTGDYLVQWSCELGNTAGGNESYGQVQEDGTNIAGAFITRIQTVTNTFCPCGGIAVRTLTGGVVYTYTIQFRAGSGTARVQNARMVIRRLL